jgi:hypothetical protein
VHFVNDGIGCGNKRHEDPPDMARPQVGAGRNLLKLLAYMLKQLAYCVKVFP